MNTADLTVLEHKQGNPPNSTWRDWLGIVASIGCAIHCAAMPFVIAYLPSLGLSFLADEAFHKWMALVCFLIAIAAFLPGIRKHGNWIPISIGTFGLGFITFAAFGLAGECCPSCEAATSPSSIQTTDVGAESECESCSDCESCASTSESDQSDVTIASAENTDAKTTKKKDLLGTLAPWLTPFGGLLLVGAHLLNKRYGALCACC